VNRRVDTGRWLAVLLIGLVAAGAAALVQRTGSSARVYGEAVWPLNEPIQAFEVVETATGLHDVLVRSGRRGRVVVYLSRYLHFVPVEGAVPNGLNRFPIPPIDLVDEYAVRVDPKNVLWVVLQEGIAREVVHVLPRQEYESRRSGITAGSPGIALRPAAIVTHEVGSRRTVQSELPALGEPVILGIDAAYLDGADVFSTIDLLRASGLGVDLVVLNLSLDNPDVSDLGRNRLRDLAAALEDAS
jgi:hypothetical protein